MYKYCRSIIEYEEFIAHRQHNKKDLSPHEDKKAVAVVSRFAFDIFGNYFAKLGEFIKMIQNEKSLVYVADFTSDWWKTRSTATNKRRQ